MGCRFCVQRMQGRALFARRSCAAVAKLPGGYGIRPYKAFLIIKAQFAQICSLIWLSAAFSKRLTWAWLMPISFATCVWVLPFR